MNHIYLYLILSATLISCNSDIEKSGQINKPRIIVTTDGEIDDECSMVRLLLYASEFEIEGIITSSSQYHSHGHNWAGDDWIDPYLDAYEEVYPNLIKHDGGYPTPGYLRSVTFLGNVEAEGEMDSITPGSQHIVEVLLDTTDDRAVWLQAWGGPNTIARALRTIEEDHPDRMDYVANKIRFFFIWEQDSTYQSYIRPHWGKYNILTIICDQFWAIAYQWDRVLPEKKQVYFTGDWMRSHVLEDHGALCSLYKAYEAGNDRGFDEGDFRSEGDSPAFMYEIVTGLRNGNLDHPDWGSWGGRYQKVRENTWLDPVPEPGYTYPEGRWYTATAWGRKFMREEYPEHPELMQAYFKPIARWADAFQNDFAARADWCVLPYREANHPPVVKLDHSTDQVSIPGSVVHLSAKGTSDPDGDQLAYHWWFYEEPGSYKGAIEIENADAQNASLRIPGDVDEGAAIHIICEVKDLGSPQLTRYKRVIINIEF